jgi:hypothetical protein
MAGAVLRFASGKVDRAMKAVCSYESVIEYYGDIVVLRLQPLSVAFLL